MTSNFYCISETLLSQSSLSHEVIVGLISLQSGIWTSLLNYELKFSFSDLVENSYNHFFLVDQLTSWSGN